MIPPLAFDSISVKSGAQLILEFLTWKRCKNPWYGVKILIGKVAEHFFYQRIAGPFRFREGSKRGNKSKFFGSCLFTVFRAEQPLKKFERGVLLLPAYTAVQRDKVFCTDTESLRFFTGYPGIDG